MRYWALLAICVLQITLLVQGEENESKYTVIGPGTLHSNRHYNVAVSGYKVGSPLKIKVGITGPSYNETKEVDLAQDGTKEISFDVPKLESGKYNLTAEGLSGIIFKNTTLLNQETFKNYVKIQTDKGVYKPGDTVNFRVIFLDENLKPGLPSKDVIIWFEDSKRNRIKEIKDLEVVKGVYTGKFEISEYAVLGYWRIVVHNADTYDQQASFKIDKYTLPKYKVDVTATESVSVLDGDMQVVVRANYTYGKPVDAKVTLVCELDNNVYGSEKEVVPAPKLIKTTDMVKGKAKFDFNVKEYGAYMPQKLSSYYFKIFATVEENFTGVKINGTANSFLYPYRYFMNCVNYPNCSTFYPDKETEIIFRLSYVDNSPLKDTKSEVKLTYTENVEKTYWNEDKDKPIEPNPVNNEKSFTFTSRLNDTSFVNFVVVLPSLAEYNGYSHHFKMEIEYAGEKRNVFTAYQYREPKEFTPTVPNEEPKDYFRLRTIYDEKKYSYEIGDKATVTVNSSEPLSYIVYNLIGRGNILHSERIELPNKPKEYNITFPTTFSMAPWVKIYVYYVDEHGNYHHEETSFRTAVKLQNEITITAVEQTKPGDDVALKIKTPANSFVGLLAIDQSVTLLGSNNDITASDFQWRLSNYNTHTPWQGGYSYYPGQSSGVVTLTNAHYEYNWTEPDYTISTFRSDMVQHDIPMSFSHSTKTSMRKGPPGPLAAASPVFIAGFGAPESGGGNIQVRSDFSETWIFDNINSTDSDEFTYTKKIPHTITKWLLSGFALNDEKGLAVTKDQTKITTFQPFFVAIRLPYSVKRGEVINVPALVFNYLEKDLDVTITLDNVDDEFEFTEVSNEVINDKKRTATVRVDGNSAAGASFMIRPKIVGNILLKFTAISPIAGDAVHKSLKVVPEGITEYKNRAYLVDLKNGDEFKETLELDLPKEIVPLSQHTEFAVVGDLLGPVMNNLENLVRLPQGCGEQTTSKMVPNILVYRYLKSINKLTPALSYKILNGLQSGYQNILKFQHSDGSFSSFGPRENSQHPVNGSTWLTAYVLRSLNKTTDLINVDEKLFENGFKYLASKQAENGTFLEAGELFFNHQKRHVSLTANVLLAFFANEKASAQYKAAIDKGLKYLLDNFDAAEDLRSKVIIVYTLLMAKHPMSKEHTAKLKDKAKTEEGFTHWSDDKTSFDPVYLWRWSFSSDVENTAYMLLNLLQSENETSESLLPILRWLVAQRNSYGGFYSTQDTVVGLQAMIEFAIKYNYSPAEADVSIKAKGDKEKLESLKINEGNSVLMQIVELPPKTNAIDFKLNGKGTALVQVSYQYNILEKDKKPSFVIKTNKHPNAPPSKLEMQVCVEYTGEGDASNMAILEVELPSGYIAEKETFEEINKVKRVRQIETKKDDTVIVVYFESLHKSEEQCVPVEAVKAFPVALQKPATIVLYDYYDTSKKATDYYESKSKLCDICEDDEKCKEACK
ncbi:pregnancy zone protein [Teleopsis dalmanni]|uniref:pregnancy zone protein n=1 Tax=Teleopsis dalmanni TaxID=139649 RepID=UPI0018CFC9B6|nr:pregnancy zone protein [Teleopsis dalmanni]